MLLMLLYVILSAEWPTCLQLACVIYAIRTISSLFLSITLNTTYFRVTSAQRCSSNEYAWSLQRVRIARYAKRCNSQRDSVRLSVCPSVTFRYCVQMNEDTIVRFWASVKTILLVSWKVKSIRIFAGITPAGALKWGTPMSLAKIWPIIGHNLSNGAR